jgi:hypothetical protein
MDTTVELDDARNALKAAAQFAGRAPSIHNTQPWLWRLVGPELQLWAVRERQLDVTDPQGHLMLVSCGAALHHATVALAAQGWLVEVTRAAGSDARDLLATLRVVGRADSSATSDASGSMPAPAARDEAERAVEALGIRRTDRRPVSEVVPPMAAIDAIAAAASAAGANLHVLRQAEVIELAVAADHAQEVELADAGWQDELAYWAGGARPGGSGVPDTAIPDVPVASTVPGRNFGRDGQLPVSAGHDGAAVYAILFGQDSTAGWLHAGEALSAAWVSAIEHGLSLLPMSAAVEIPATRQTMRLMLANLAEPYLAMRLGFAESDVPGPGHTPRLPVHEILEVSP